MARGARARGLAGHRGHLGRPVDVGRARTRVGSRLLDEADLVIDLCTPPADAMVDIDGLDTPGRSRLHHHQRRHRQRHQGPAAQLLTERGAMPPVITRASEVGTERSTELFEAAYDEHARRIARAIDKP